jgi:hypothetical protein
MASDNLGTRIDKAPAPIAQTAGMGAFWGTCVGFPVWGLVSFILKENVNQELSLAVAALVSGALGGAPAAFLTRARPVV